MVNSVIEAETIEHCLRRMAQGDRSAREQLLVQVSGRLVRLTRRMKREFPTVGRWEQTDDVLQSALLRLCRSFDSVELESPLHFYRLAALQIRRELLDLCRYYEAGPDRPGQGWAGAGADHPHETPEAVEQTRNPSHLAEWEEFHQVVQTLPEELRDVFDLFWYAGMSQQQAADVLQVSVKTVQRRWRAARLHLSEALEGTPPM
jgi:RNA polymerase sigma-70 factor (ECF subfamily)